VAGFGSRVQVAAACYEKTFPHLPEHAILSALGTFKQLFNDVPFFAAHNPPAENKITEQQEKVEAATFGDDYFQKWVSSQEHVFSQFFHGGVSDNVVFERWAREAFDQMFVHQIDFIRRKYPEDHVNIVNGVTVPFWNSKVRRPEPIKFNTQNETCKLFVSCALQLLRRVLHNRGFLAVASIGVRIASI